MRKLFTAFAIAAGLALAGCATTAAARRRPPPTGRRRSGPRALGRVDIPYETFTLANGLRVVVHEDRKAPVVAVSVWYNVGSKDEPRGPHRLRAPVRASACSTAPRTRRATISNLARDGRDRLERHHLVRPHQLFPDRAAPGARAGAVPRERPHGLSARRAHPGEARPTSAASSRTRSARATTSPIGMVEYAQLEGLFPEGHPYRHSTIGSMADLDAASLETCASGSATITGRTTPCWCWPATSTPPRRGRWSSAISATSRAARSTIRPRPTCRRCRARVDGRCTTASPTRASIAPGSCPA